MLGIENLKKLLKVGLNFGQKVASDLKDKKISFFEAIGLVPDVFSIVGVVKTWKDIKAELDDLDDSEKAELEKYVMDEFDIPNEKVEIFIEHALAQIVSLAALVNEFKHINDPIVP